MRTRRCTGKRCERRSSGDDFVGGNKLVMALNDSSGRRDRLLTALPGLLPEYLMRQRWFGGKARGVQSVEVSDAIPLAGGSVPAVVALARVQFVDGDSHVYAVPLAAASPERAAALSREGRDGLILSVPAATQGQPDEKWCDALWDPEWPQALLGALAEGRSFRGTTGELRGVPTRAFARLRGDAKQVLAPSVMSAEQSNTSVRFADRLIFKLFRRLQTGVNPDVEICTFLTERTSFKHFPAVAGSLILRQDGCDTSLAILQAFVSNRGDAWKYTLAELDSYFDRLGDRAHGPAPAAARLFPLPVSSPAEGAPPSVESNLGAYLGSARLLGERTAQLHLALASVADDAAFSPEPFSPSYQRSLYEFMLNLSTDVFALLRRRLDQLGAGLRQPARDVLQREGEVEDRLRSVLDRPIEALRIRIHGDYHLGQVLYTGDDFVIIDFEGEPARSVSDRRIKRSPLRDVAGMLRSFHYAAFTAFLRRAEGADGPKSAALECWARHWQASASAAFLKAYLSAARGAAFLPHEPAEIETLLRAFLLDKAVYELGYELNNRPDWVKIPLQGIQDVVGGLG
jgi:trehalose synthase-fused probable maltokinase